MRRLMATMTVVALVGACAQTQGAWTVGGRGQRAILIMGEDADSDSIARGDRNHARVLNEIAAALASRGNSVYDETAVTLGTSTQGRARRSDAELIDLARGVRNPPIDVVVIFTAYAQASRFPFTDKVTLRVAGRLISVGDGRRLGNFESSHDGNLRPDCSESCRAETIGGIARIVAQEVGDVLAEKLAAEAPPAQAPAADAGLVKGYALVFDEFSPAEMREIEDYLVIFSGYRSHRPMASLGRHFEVWYESSITEAKLQRNLTRMLEELGLVAQIRFVGNEYTVRQIRIPAERAPRRSSTGW